MSSRAVLRALVALVLVSGAAQAEDYSPEFLAELAAEAGIDAAALTIEGDAEYGAYLSGECTTCHQNSGDNDGIPSIVLWPDVYFMLAMHEYKTKRRDHPAMQMIAGRLGDEEIAALAAYFAELEEQ